MAESSFVVNDKVDYDALMIELDILGARLGKSLPTKLNLFRGCESLRIHVDVDQDGRIALFYTKIKKYADASNVFVKGMKLEKKGDSIVIKEDKHSKLMYKIQETEDKLAELKKEAVDSLKEEKKYYVVLPDPQRKQKGAYSTSLIKMGDSRVFISDTDLSSVISNECYHLTESEIKANHDWAWQFAKEVD